MSPLYKMNAGEFARRLRRDSEMQDKRFAFFLGAGCSISSGIPGASSLVKDYWLPRLQELIAPDRKDIEAWIKEEFPDHDSNNPSSSYGPILERLFLNAEDRQREIERWCEGKFPGFGYAVLATLISKYGGIFNVVVTTNFDDLVSDALYLFTRTRPLVIGHESLAGYIRPTRTRPLVIKIHGDARLSPQNTIAETGVIQKEVERQVNVLLHDRALIFMGYGGNDKGIANMLSDLPREALPFGVYWVSGTEPQGVLRTWLEARKAVWVEKFDFDEVMLLIRDAFDLPHPDQKPFENIFQNYAETYKKISGQIRSTPSKANDEALTSALERADKNLMGWLAAAVAAEQYEKTDPDLAENFYVDGLERFPTSAPLIGYYAFFLANIRKDYDKAEQFYQRAIDVDPNNANNLGDYALFLTNNRKDYGKAEQFYQRAIDVDPNHANNLNNYSLFLANTRKDYSKAEQFFQRAIDADPNSASVLGTYALFLESNLREYDRAEQFYQRAIDVDPNHANNLNNYGLFLANIRKDYDKAEQFYQYAIDAESNNANTLGNYALFLENTRKDYDKAEQFYQRAINAEPYHANNLNNYSLFLTNIRKDYDKAEQFYQRTIDADPKNVDTFGSYALFLMNIRKDYDKAEQFYQRTIDADPNNANVLGDYAIFQENIRKDYDKAQQLYQRAIDADPNHANNLNNYALFLRKVRQDYDKAEQFYQRAIAANPNNVVVLGYYALFLKNIRKDYGKAEEVYQRAVDTNPEDANNLCSYAGLALALGKKEKGYDLLEKLISFLPTSQSPGLASETWFYAFCHYPESKWNEALRNLKIALKAGDRSPDWDLSMNIERARQDSHPDILWIELLARVITKGGDITELEAWDKWKNA